MFKPLRSTSLWTIALLLAITLAGSYLRLARLDIPTMGGDVMEFYKIGQSGIHPVELWLHSSQYIGVMSPFWFAAHNGFLQSFGLEATFRNTRLLDALTGILAIGAAFGAGRLAGGRRLALLTALFVALQPLHIQMSRECYFYVPIVLGGFLSIWALLHLVARLDRNRAPGIGFYLLAGTGFLLSTHVQISSWSFALVWVLTIYTVLVREALRQHRLWGHVAGITALLFLLGLPTLLFDWGMQDAFQLTFGADKDQWSNVFGEQKRNLFSTAWTILTSYLAGRGLLRSGASLLLLITGVGSLTIAWKKTRSLRVLASLAAGAFALLAFMHSRSVFPAESRHYASIVPLLALVSGLGLVGLADQLAARLKLSPPAAGLPLAVFTLLLVALLAPPAWMVTRIVGSPPFRQVSEWADRHLPPGTPVLCDRWFNPWNEFRVNPSTNVLYTFTVPSEPVQVYASSRWRETAKEFFAINPLAAYFEQKTYWTRLGPWTWPHSQFARQQEFADPVADRLDRMGLFYRSVGPDYPREWIPVTLFYNTENDLVERAAKAGDRILCLFGTGWTYTKTQDYRDWYLLRDEASLVLHNLTASPITATVNLTGVAVEGSVTLSGPSGPPAVFPPNQILARSIGPVSLAPGRNEISLSIRSGSPPGAALLVQRTSAKEISPPPP